MENFKTPILRHISFLANQDKFPEHLKITGKDGKKTRVRKYIDLYTGDTFIEQGKKLLPENPDNRSEK